MISVKNFISKQSLLFCIISEFEYFIPNFALGSTDVLVRLNIDVTLNILNPLPWDGQRRRPFFLYGLNFNMEARFSRISLNVNYCWSKYPNQVISKKGGVNVRHVIMLTRCLLQFRVENCHAVFCLRGIRRFTGSPVASAFDAWILNRNRSNICMYTWTRIYPHLPNNTSNSSSR